MQQKPPFESRLIVPKYMEIFIVYLHIFAEALIFRLADVRCVCQQEDRCNNLDKPGRGNRKSAASASSLSLSLLSLVMVILTASSTL